MAVLLGGRTVQSGPIAEVFAHPEGAEVAELVGVETVLPVRVEEAEDGMAVVAHGDVRLHCLAPAEPASEATCAIRAEDVLLHAGAGDEGESSARNHLPAIVRSLIPEGPTVRVELDAGLPLVARVTTAARAELRLEPGAPVVASIKATAIRLYVLRHYRGN